MKGQIEEIARTLFDIWKNNSISRLYLFKNVKWLMHSEEVKAWMKISRIKNFRLKRKMKFLANFHSNFGSQLLKMIGNECKD